MIGPDDWPCPQLAPHPPGRIGTPVTSLDWTAEQPYRSRVLSYTCSCRTIVDELLASGGMYLIRRSYQTTPPRVSYAGPWSRPRAQQLWDSIITGEAHLRQIEHPEHDRSTPRLSGHEKNPKSGRSGVPISRARSRSELNSSQLVSGSSTHA